jgi:hypothetical protein
MNAINQLIIASFIFAISSCSNTSPEKPTTVHPNAKPIGLVNDQTGKRKIKLAILLDTSGSMDGLIEQAKSQLWKIVTQLSKTKEKDGSNPEIELALYEYGNDNIPMTADYIKQVSGFTSELDEISEKLFALQTYGGSEFCGSAIKTSLRDLKWSNNKNDLQLLYIAGNEEFNQGSVPFKDACLLAKEKNVVVNTIYCGDYEEGKETFWKTGADLANGMYFNIDQDAQIVYYDSPYDSKISQLNVQLNDTYIPYGSLGREKKVKQVKEDENSELVSYAVATDRCISKSSKAYSNTSWDMVDAYKNNKSFTIKDIKKQELPQELKGLSEKEIKAYILKKDSEREKIKKEMNQLNQKRETYIAKKQKEDAKNGSISNLESALIKSVTKQVKRKSFVISKDIN